MVAKKIIHNCRKMRLGSEDIEQKWNYVYLTPAKGAGKGTKIR